MEKKTIAVIGMMCAGCAANVERKMNQLEGVATASVNFPARTVLVEYDPSIITPQQMKDEIVKAGYDLVIEEDRNIVEIEKNAYRQLRQRVIISWIFAFLVMAIAMGWIHVGDRNVANQTMLIISLANLIYCGRQFFVNAWKQLLHRMANMDTLVAMSTGISFLFSTVNTFWGEQLWGSRGISWNTYFDASVMIITFVLTGRLMEERAKNGTASAIRALMGLAPKTARLDTGDEVPIATLQKGDVIIVKAGEKIPVDGSVLTDDHELRIDESMITGEPLPEAKKVGDHVYAGTIVKGGTLRFRAQQVGKDTMLANIIRMVQEAQGSKAPVQRVVDKIALVFVPAVLAVSILTFIIWWVFGGEALLPKAILSAVSVLVIACPCALGLATPTALMVGIGKAAQKNILIKDAAALENIRNINALVIDKTGTLTIPNGELTAGNGKTDAPFTTLSTQLEQRETLKPHAREAMRSLQEQGVDIYMCSGDKEEAAAYWAEKAGISHYRSQVLPQDKEDLVRELQAQGKHVAMVGDGINDTQALAAADVSIAMGKGTDIAMDVAQVTLMGTDLRRIPDAIRLSKETVGMIRQNLFWAFIYNIICIPLAAGIPYLFGMEWQITPMWASALMAFSSVSVVMNSLRLKWKG